VTGGTGGLLFDEGPTACPFVALDRDRERRADEPDSRHRCYATPTPEPRALAHQRNYCLTANFSACPIFQDWAIRAAARPVPLRPVPPALALIEAERPVGEPELTPADEPVETPAGEPQQPGLFDEPAKPPALPEAPPMPTFRLTAPAEGPPAGDNIVPAPAPAIIPPPIRPTPLATPSAAAFSAPAAREAARQPAPPVVSATPAPAPPKPTPSKPIKPPKSSLRREDIVPVWERARYDVPEPGKPARRGRDLFSWLTILFAVLAVVTLAALAVLLLPALFGGRPGTATPTPSLVAGATATAATSATPAASAPATWQTYTIALGDNLYKIATKFNITYDQLLAANPQITNPDFIVTGQVINIPPPTLVVPSPSAAPSATASPSASPTKKP
jgi:LysM repeat protein